MNNELLMYFNGDELAASTWKNKYALEGEITPNDMHMRLAKEFSRIEYDYCKKLLTEKIELNNLSDAGKKYYHSAIDIAKTDDQQYLTDNIYNLFKDFKYIVPGGSIMATLGSDKLSSLSNCFVIDQPKDSVAGIMRQINNQAQLMKYRGGVGFDMSSLRPSGSDVKNSAKTSTGPPSFMDLFSTVTNTIAQDGRRGALMLTINIAHPDSEEVIMKKQDLTKVTGANISIQVTDEFMKAVKADEDFILSFPLNFKLSHNVDIKKLPYNKLISINSPNKHYGYIKKIKAAELWNKLIKCAWSTAEPGILFIDRIHQYSPDGVYDKYKAISTNPCQPEWATILTPTGIRTFRDINVGDLIWSSEGWTTVVKKECSGTKDVYNYKTSAGTFSGTDTHRVVSKGVKVEVKDAETIDVLAGFNSSTIGLNPADIMDGLVMGDGSIHTASKDLVYLCIGENDQDYLTSDIQTLITKERPGIKPYAFEVNTTIVPSELPRTFERSIPRRFLEGSAYKVKGFLKGLYSANGSVVNKRITLKTASPYIRDEVQLMLSSIGIRSYYTTNKPKDVEFANGIYTCKESYDINISTDREIFYYAIGFIQKYKMDALKASFGKISPSDKTHNITNIEWNSKEPVYNITVDNKSHTYWTGGLNVSNCGEIPMGPYDSCRLIHINLTSCVENPFTKEAQLNDTKLYEICYSAMRLADSLIDLEIEAIDKILNKVKVEKDDFEITLWEKIKINAVNVRRTGVGFTGLADVFAMLNIPYSSKEALAMIDQIGEIKMGAELDCTIDLAVLRGKFPEYKGELEYEIDDDLVHYSQNEFYRFLQYNYSEQFYRMYIEDLGRRNISWSTIAPTGTVSIMTKTSSGIEPIFAAYYVRRRKCSSPTDKVDFIDLVGEKYTEFYVLHPAFKEWIFKNYNWDPKDHSYIDNLTKEDLKQYFEESPWYGSTSSEIDSLSRIKLQGSIQKYITHAISSTLNLPKETTEADISRIYLLSWNNRLKGVTIYRDGSREGILNNASPTQIKPEEGRQALKRPKILEADYYQVKSKGQQYIVLVGLLNNNPYEIFTFKPTTPVEIKTHKGTITKIKKNQYAYDSEFIHIDNLELSTESIEEKACCLYTSMLLRHNADIKFIIKTAEKVDDNITSFSSAMCRILRKYTKSEEVKGEVCPDCGGKLIRESGCIRCIDCNYSKCS